MRSLVRALPLLSLCALASCGGGGGRGPVSSAPLRFATPEDAPARYAPPGPPKDPWGPYIAEAATRFHVPPDWVRAVMRQESGGHQYMNGRPITSYAGAMGLMQLTGPTYQMLRDRYGLGDDPYYPRDNILAGTAYIAELYRRFGSPEFLAAYNAGPRTLDDYHAGKRSALPDQTVQYLAAVGPRLSPYGGTATYAPVSQQPLPSEPVQVAEAPAPPPPHHGFSLVGAAYADTVPVRATDTLWGVQVGAFPDPAQARQVAEKARAAAPQQLAAARPVLGQTAPGSTIFSRARLTGISHPAATGACQNLAAQRWDCLIVPPGG